MKTIRHNVKKLSLIEMTREQLIKKGYLVAKK